LSSCTTAAVIRSALVPDLIKSATFLYFPNNNAAAFFVVFAAVFRVDVFRAAVFRVGFFFVAVFLVSFSIL
jgi:hypothetical protein